MLISLYVEVSESTTRSEGYSQICTYKYLHCDGRRITGLRKSQRSFQCVKYSVSQSEHSSYKCKGLRVAFRKRSRGGAGNPEATKQKPSQRVSQCSSQQPRHHRRSSNSSHSNRSHNLKISTCAVGKAIGGRLLRQNRMRGGVTMGSTTRWAACLGGC